MGLKYIEQIKSVILFVLVLLSITLTFSIWTYRPNYAPLEKTKSVDILVGKKLQLVDIIKPYRMVFHQDGMWLGTDQSKEMSGIIDQMQNWQVTNPTLVSGNLDSSKINQLVAGNQHYTLFYSSEIPYSIFQDFLPTTENKVNDISFDQMIVTWNQLSNSGELTVFFANTAEEKLYKAKAHVKSKSIFEKQLVRLSHDLERYSVFYREKGTALYLPTKESKMIQSAYIVNNISVDKFKNAVFANPEVVKNSFDDANVEENFTDGVSIMKVNSNKRVLDYVNTTASDNHERVEKSKLIINTFDFINRHGGWTGDFRYDSLDYENNKVTYQLYMGDYPVYADLLDTSTQIVTVWGDNRIAVYARPYYKLVPSLENTTLTITGGQEVVDNLMKLKTVNFKDIKEIRPGYFLTKNGQNAFIFKPTWFYLVNNKWSPLQTTTVGGGGQVGLE